MAISNYKQISLFDSAFLEIQTPKNKKRKHYKKPSYKKIDRIDKQDLNYLTLRRLYVELANYCPRPLSFEGLVPEKINIEGVITLWCTKYSRDDEFAIEQLPSVYYEAEINNTWNMKLFDKIRLHSDLLKYLKMKVSLKAAVKMAVLSGDTIV